MGEFMTWQNIIVSSKILGHISAGIYRSAGGALKELVSNAFDADATQVIITTNHPSFDIITCYDNGKGMTLDGFERIMQGGIGESPKRVETDITLGLSRPMIGKLGIGMLGIAQICYDFKVISHHKESKKAFQATVKLIDYLHERMDETPPEEERDEEDKDLDVGKFSIEEIKYDPKQTGTYIIAANMRPAFIKKFRERPGPSLPAKFSSFLNIIHRKRSVKELGDYWQMIWEMAIACPLPYKERGPFQWSKIKAPPDLRDKLNKLVESLEKYQFEVIVDGLSLRKPHVYPYPSVRRDGNKKTPLTGQLFGIDYEAEVYGKPLKLLGYIYLQDGQAIEPHGLRGLLIRIRNVAIGGYDQTFLDYPKIEGPRFNWLSSEIYVPEGLEQALNIDRDSFNEIHSHFFRLQRIVHDLLSTIFPEASKGVKQRSQQKHQSEQDRKIEALQQLLSQELKGSYKVEEIEGNHFPLSIDTDRKKVMINIQSPLWPRSKNKRALAQLVAVAFEVSLLTSEPDQREKFYKLLSQVLSL